MSSIRTFLSSVAVCSGLANGIPGSTSPAAWRSGTAASSCSRRRTCSSIPTGTSTTSRRRPGGAASGFGMEDAHAVANSLQWGPDGWLYERPGEHRDGEHPRHRVPAGHLALSSDHQGIRAVLRGGGNTWGLDFDRHGNAIAGTNFGDRVLLHQVQGAYYLKNFGKHGALHNSHAFGYFDHAPYKDPEHLRGDHVTCGGSSPVLACGSIIRRLMSGRRLITDSQCSVGERTRLIEILGQIVTRQSCRPF